MSEIILLSTINLRSSTEKAVEIFRDISFDHLFLDLPTYQEEAIRSIALGTPYTEVVQRLKNMRSIKEPEDTQKYRAMEPILDYISRLDPHVGIHCFRDPVYHHFSREVMDEVFVKTCVSKLFRIRVEEWFEILEEEVRVGLGCVVREAKTIARKARGRSVCIGASEDLRPPLEERGHSVSWIEVDRSYSPLDVLRGKVRRWILHGEEVSEDEVKDLVHRHLEFTEMVLMSGLEEAYRRWVSGCSTETGRIIGGSEEDPQG